MVRPFCRFALVSTGCPPRYRVMMHSRFLACAGGIALAVGLAFPLAAQTMAPAGGALPPADPAQTLSENLKALARDPYNVDALLQAGFGALAVEDPNAAFGFFARAEELSPSNARAKAGLGSALIMMEKPRDALRAFDEAVALGMPEASILQDRGLAHDLSGDARKAQKDYLAALKTNPSDELTRRLALSLGISGEKDAALARLDPLIRRNDQAAWRARAFILAMNGDSPGAEKIVRMVAPAGTSASMLSFMQRLADLGPAARARAVHFGTLPANGTGYAEASEDDSFRPVDPSAAARLAAPTPVRPSVVAAAPLSAKEARRKAREDERLAKLAERGRQASDQRPDTATAARSATPPAVAARVAAVLPSSGEKLVVIKGATSLPTPDAVLTVPSSKTPPAPLFEVPAAPPRVVTPAPAPSLAAPPLAAPPPPVRVADVVVPAEVKPLPAPAPSSTGAVANTVVDVQTPKPTAAAITAVDLPQSAATQQQLASAMTSSVPVNVTPPPPPTSMPMPIVAETAPPTAESTPTTAPVPAPAPVLAARPPVSLADIVKTLELEQESAAAALPDAAQLRAARIAAQKKAAADAKLKADKLAEEKRIAEEEAKARRNPARIWVQVATGNNEAGLPGTWRRLKEQAGKSLSRQSAWTVPFRQTNRLLVGPLKSVGDARDLVSSLAKEGVQATTFTSDAGQEIFRIGGK